MLQKDLNLCQKIKWKINNGRSNRTRKAGSFFLLLVLCTALISGIYLLKWINNTSRFQFSRLVIIGKKRYTTNDDICHAILALEKHSTLISQDINAIQQEIERFPWIKRVRVRKEWPDKLKIHLIEYVPVARWNDFQMIDAEGKSFNLPIHYVFKGVVPLLYGPNGNERDVLRKYYQMSAMLAASKIRIKAASMNARHSYQLVTVDDIRIELGRSDNISRLNRFIELWPVIQKKINADNKHINYIDLRYNSGAAISLSSEFIDSCNNNQKTESGTGYKND